MAIVCFFLILAQKYPNRAFVVPNLGTFIFHEIWQLETFEAADFKYDNIIYKSQPKNTQIRHF